MNLTEFHKQLADAPLCFRRKLRDYLRYPTERNACFIAGYAAALEDTHRFKTADAARYWSAVIGLAEANATMCRELIAEVDNPPVEDVNNDKEPGIEDLEHETDYCAARNDRIERSALQDEALLRQALEALKAENERLRTDGASAVRWAPGSAYWSEVLVELFGPDARKGIDVLETRWRKELERANTAETLLRQALEALERGAWDTLRGRNAAAAIREWLGEKA